MHFVVFFTDWINQSFSELNLFSELNHCFIYYYLFILWVHFFFYTILHIWLTELLHFLVLFYLTWFIVPKMVILWHHCKNTLKNVLQWQVEPLPFKLIQTSTSRFCLNKQTDWYTFFISWVPTAEQEPAPFWWKRGISVQQTHLVITPNDFVLVWVLCLREQALVSGAQRLWRIPNPHKIFRLTKKTP